MCRQGLVELPAGGEYVGNSTARERPLPHLTRFEKASGRPCKGLLRRMKIPPSPIAAGGVKQGIGPVNARGVGPDHPIDRLVLGLPIAHALGAVAGDQEQTQDGRGAHRGKPGECGLQHHLVRRPGVVLSSEKVAAGGLGRLVEENGVRIRRGLAPYEPLPAIA